MSARRARGGHGRSRVFAAVLSPVVAWVVVQAPRVAVACSVCTAGRDEENAAAFLWSTIFMSITPLLVIGAIVYFLVRRVRRFEAEQTARREAAGAIATRPVEAESA